MYGAGQTYKYHTRAHWHAVSACVCERVLVCVIENFTSWCVHVCACFVCVCVCVCVCALIRVLTSSSAAALVYNTTYGTSTDLTVGLHSSTSFSIDCHGIQA